MGYRDLGAWLYGDVVAPVDGAPDDPSVRTLGPGANQAAPGDRVPGVFPTARTAAGINAAVAAIGSARETMRLTPGTWTIDAAVTIPANVTLRVDAGALVTKSGSGSIAVNGALRAPECQVFFGFAAGDVRLGQGIHRHASPLWWGAVSDATGAHGVGTDCLLAFQCAVDAALAAGASARVLIPPGAFRLTGKLRCNTASGLPRGVHMQGAGKQATYLIIDADTSTDALAFESATFYGAGGCVSDLSISSADATRSRDLLTFNRWNKARFDNLDIINAGRDGIHIANSMDLKFDHCKAEYSERHALFTTGPDAFNTTLRFSDCYFLFSNDHNANVWSETTYFIGCIFEEGGIRNSTDSAGLVVRSGTVLVMGCHFEANRGHDLIIGDDASPDTTYATCVSAIGNYFYHGGLKAEGNYGIYVIRGIGGLITGSNFSDFSLIDESHLYTIQPIAFINNDTAAHFRVIEQSSLLNDGGGGGSPTLPIFIENGAVAPRDFNGILEYPGYGFAMQQVGNFRIEPKAGVVLRAPDGTRYLVKVANDGTLSTETVT